VAEKVWKKGDAIPLRTLPVYRTLLELDGYNQGLCNQTSSTVMFSVLSTVRPRPDSLSFCAEISSTEQIHRERAVRVAS